MPRSGPPRAVASRVVLSVMGLILVGAVGGAAWWHRFDVAALRVPATVAPADALQKTLLERNRARPGDPDLVAAYGRINERHFGGALPPVAVLWEPALDDVGALAAGRFTLEGMVGRTDGRILMLLNPRLRTDAGALARALCHEIVHVQLMILGDDSGRHNTTFQTVLRRLWTEGAFEGTPATDAEKAVLRTWLDTETDRMEAEDRELTRFDQAIARERADLDAAITEFNQRNARGGAVDARAPTADEARTLAARRDRLNDLIRDTNDRLARAHAARAHFDAEVARYNLMLVYPDGSDEDRPPRPVTAPPALSR